MKNDRYREMTAALVLLVLTVILLGFALSPIPEMALGVHAERDAAAAVSLHDTCFFLRFVV